MTWLRSCACDIHSSTRSVPSRLNASALLRSDVEQRLQGRSSLVPEELKELGSDMLRDTDRDSLEELRAAEVSPDDERQ